MTRFLAIILVLFLLSSSSAPTISAHFFPNISAIPPELLKNASSAWDNFQKFAGCRAGNKQDGLGKLKKYFHYFGYIPNSVSNFTDDFDNELESALKTYQQNFNLNVTGQLDEDTLKQMIRPRCGNADIVNGSTTMNSGKTTPSSSSFHTVGHYAFFPGNPRWPSNKRDLTYAFFDSNLTQEAKDVFSRAFARWSTVIPMTFEETDSVADADIRIGFFSGDHGDGEPFDGVLGTLAHAFSPPSGRFHLDADENWVVTTDYSTSLLSSVASAVDLESVAVHEIGHLLGLGHSSVEGAIMYPTISSGTRKVELAADDITGVQLLYGSNPNYNSSSSATPAANERENNGAYSLVEAGSRWGLASFLAAAGFYLLFL